MNLKKNFPKTLVALPLTLFVASCQTSNEFIGAEVNTAVSNQIEQAQQVDLPAVPENCKSKYSSVKVVLPKNSRLESDARRLRAGLDLANTRISAANAQIERCLGQDGWYEAVREGFNQPAAPAAEIKEEDGAL